MNTKFAVRPNGDDAHSIYTTDNYADAEHVAKARSDHWLGMALYSARNGKVATFKDGTCTGYLDGSGSWVTK